MKDFNPDILKDLFNKIHNEDGTRKENAREIMIQILGIKNSSGETDVSTKDILEEMKKVLDKRTTLKEISNKIGIKRNE